MRKSVSFVRRCPTAASALFVILERYITRNSSSLQPSTSAVMPMCETKPGISELSCSTRIRFSCVQVLPTTSMPLSPTTLRSCTTYPQRPWDITVAIRYFIPNFSPHPMLVLFILYPVCNTESSSLHALPEEKKILFLAAFCILFLRLNFMP